MVELNITLEGETLMSRALMVSAAALADFSVPLTEASSELQKTFQLNFDAEGGLFGGWAPRQDPSGTWPLLQKTGAMRQSFYTEVTGVQAILGNTASYFKYHQSNAPRKTKLPRRVMMAIQDTQRVLIQKIFQQHIIDSTSELR